ncbi:transketolase [Tepidanaerobacter acetatoxydans]|nr:transketolase [Tepidanaerobacter acetatoxydans]AEE92083.1 Transketolase [Tepidanaerobacter acetatoxydans Re1]
MTNTELQRIANRLRMDVVETVYAVKDGHPGPCMSIAEIMAVLYFDEMNINPKNPQWTERDRFILSKGHACPIMYAALARKGYFEMEELKKLRMFEGSLQGHPDMHKTPGVDMTSGSLGNGVGIGLGMALGCRMQDINNYIYVIVGDGEQQEGVIWEAAMAAAKHEVGNLIVFGDCNNNQSGGKVTELSSLYPTADKWRAFHWHVQTIDGHDIDSIKEAIANAKAVKDQPSYIECKTVKGKNIPYMENNNAWHKKTPTAEEVEIAREALKGGM